MISFSRKFCKHFSEVFGNPSRDARIGTVAKKRKGQYNIRKMEGVSKTMTQQEARWFLSVELLLYAAFLALDLAGVGTLWSKGLKFTAILLCFFFALSRGRNADGRLTAAALGFTLAADLFLLVLEREFLLGVCLFCAVQTLYLLRILRLQKTGPGRSLLPRCLLALGTWGLLGSLGLLEPLTAAAAFYFSQLIANALQSAALGRAYAGFTLGLWLFVCCDICVGLHNLSAFLPAVYSGGVFAFADIGMWLFYLPSQVLIALSAGKE